MPASSDQLLDVDDTLAKLYDPDSMMSIKKSVASGFIILLGGVANKKKKKQKADISLAFMSLTQGNVIDACFGVSDMTRREETPASRAVREAKELLEDNSASDSFKRVAVQAYAGAFQQVVLHRDQVDRLNCITRCMSGKKIRTNTERKLENSFAKLVKKLEE